jgi:hypothetical protein
VELREAGGELLAAGVVALDQGLDALARLHVVGHVVLSGDAVHIRKSPVLHLEQFAGDRRGGAPLGLEPHHRGVFDDRARFVGEGRLD